MDGFWGVSYDHAISSKLRLGLSADARYSSSYYATGFYNPIDVQPHYISVDAAVRLGTANDRWELALIGRNLTNRFILNGAFDAAGTGGPGVPATQIGLVGVPRTIQAQITFRY